MSNIILNTSQQALTRTSVKSGHKLDGAIPQIVSESFIHAFQDEMGTLRSLSQPFLDTAQAAAYTGISKSHLHKLARLGIIPSTQPGGKYGKRYFTRYYLDAYMASNPSTPVEGGAA